MFSTSLSVRLGMRLSAEDEAHFGHQLTAFLTWRNVSEIQRENDLPVQHLLLPNILLFSVIESLTYHCCLSRWLRPHQP